jgi:uncharacterized membrane protein YedE/YeeE
MLGRKKKKLIYSTYMLVFTCANKSMLSLADYLTLVVPHILNIKLSYLLFANNEKRKKNKTEKKNLTN